MRAVLRGEALRERLEAPTSRAWLRSVAAGMGGQPTMAALRDSACWREHGAAVEELLGAVQAGGPSGAAPARAGASASARLRVVHWNILKGVAFDAIAEWLRDDPDLRGADAILLNEVDVGMARSGNRHVAAELAERLGLHWAFAPSYLELTRGTGPDLAAAGENALGLHGVALLSRGAPLALHACPLPESFDAFAFREKRYGRRTALLARLTPRLWVASAHLEVRGAPAGRARQMEALLEQVERRTAGQPPEAGSAGVLIGGDLNTHTFARGGLPAAAGGLARILATPRRRLGRQLLEPWRRGREPLFDLLRRCGYAWRGFNDGRATAVERLGRVEETTLLPRALRQGILGERGLGGRALDLRLDWFAGRGVEPAGPGAARTVGAIGPGGAGAPGRPGSGAAPSDHLPIVVEVEARGLWSEDSGSSGRESG
ncbi:MAG: hypothetical protein FJY75_04445 [Candidatus Eisenbacteria bacterium]|uniref:Endonuclease/exonuclease/phosphatase domain-containing protein n=1 Tax=Eiseniibacteriota bacterium TaxID=2212470 RepID=A0A938BLJ1_UNCEI|nr:hypothetical protein [Candidatus Eisenbacteria bacterium]